jgi:hypothetical protein
MRYMLSIILDPAYDAGKPAPDSLMEAMGPYVEKQVASGKMISSAGLKRTDTAVRVAGHTGKLASTDGPFTEAKEVIGGYAVIEVPNRAAAIAEANEFVQLHIDHGMPDVTVEVREIDGGYNY